MNVDFKKISLEDKHLFDKYFKNYPQETSELTFTNLFAWRKSKPVDFAIFEEHLLIRFRSKEGFRFFPPIGKDPKRIIEAILESYSDSIFERVNKKVMQEESRFRVIDDRDNYDYVYDIKELSVLPGQKFANKRNFVSRFSKNNPEVKEINDDIIKRVLTLEEDWCNLKNCLDDEELSGEYFAIKEAISNFKVLKLSGIALLVDDKVVGFAIGERLNDDTFVEHFEKAKGEIAGAYQFLLNAFAKSIPQGFTYLNREQDLGVEGMRKSKLSYNPVKMIEKVRISSQG